MSHVHSCCNDSRPNIVRAQGCYLYDVDGRQYVDFEAGDWATALGHGHPRINQVICRQIEQVQHLGPHYVGDLSEKAAEALLDVTGIGDGKCTFLCSGSEAVEFGVQALRNVTEQPLLLTFAESYLGAYGSAGQKDPSEWWLFDWTPCNACSHEGECTQDCPLIEEVPFDRIGGFVFEPGNAHGQVRLPPGQLVRALADSVRERGGFLMVNEITTGMGRTGAWFGFQHYDVSPDIVALGKGLGNGYPVSAVVLRSDVIGRLEKGSFRHVQSHQNDPAGCAVALEVIAVMQEEGWIDRGRAVGERFLKELDGLCKRHDAVREVRGRGLMITAELDPKLSPTDVISVSDGLLERGIVVGVSPSANLLRFYPPLTIGAKDITKLVESLDCILDNLP